MYCGLANYHILSVDDGQEGNNRGCKWGAVGIKEAMDLGLCRDCWIDIGWTYKVQNK